MNVLIQTTDFATGIEAVDAVAGACNLRVKRYLFSEILYDSMRKFQDPFSQVEINSLDYVFAETTGYRAALCFVDYDGQFAAAAKKGGEAEATLSLQCFLEKLRKCHNLVFVVSESPPNAVLHPEFHQMIELSYPSEELQIREWAKHLGSGRQAQEDILDLVENAPMHIHEIDFIARQAAIRAIMLGEEGKLTVELVTEVLDTHRKLRRSPVLFGSEGEPGRGMRDQKGSRCD